jgi:hypothetical protein
MLRRCISKNTQLTKWKKFEVEPGKARALWYGWTKGG